MQPVRVGFIGVGKISGQYFDHAKTFPFLEIAAVADLDMQRAREVAQERGIAKACTVDELLADDSIEIVLNLTIPKAHVPTGIQTVEAGKHTFLEKPLGISRDEGKQLLDAASTNNVRVGCAPDTFLGAGVQTARKLIDEGAIGEPVSFTAFMMGRGHETWHPSPEFYYEAGGGPMFDMGPYYLTALLNLLGPVKRIMGAATIAKPERIISSKPKYGKKITVETPDHIVGMMEFAGGAIGTIITSFATYIPTHDKTHPITIFGSEGTMRVPDPNNFDRPVLLRREGDDDFVEMPYQFVTGYGRSIGLADMASAIRNDRPHRASGEQAYAALDLMQGFLDSSETGTAHEPTLAYERPAPMPADKPLGELD